MSPMTTRSQSSSASGAESAPAGNSGSAAAMSVTGIPKPYLTVSAFWGGDTVQLDHDSGHILASIPVNFLAGCGDNTWSYVYKVLSMVAETDTGVMVYAADGSALPSSTATAPIAGSYTVRRTDGQELQIAYGPQNKRGNARGAPNLDQKESTVSASSRSSAGQSDFRHRLFIRDACCLATNAWYNDCVAAHIVPFSRRDVYRMLCGSDDYSVMFATSSGLTLGDSAHRAYDNYMWSIYCADDGSYYIHAFVADPLTYRHGSRLDPPTRFRIRPFGTSELPNRALLKWHYTQCVQARLRGYAWNMAVGAQGGRVVEVQAS